MHLDQEIQIKGNICTGKCPSNPWLAWATWAKSHPSNILFFNILHSHTGTPYSPFIFYYYYYIISFPFHILSSFYFSLPFLPLHLTYVTLFLSIFSFFLFIIFLQSQNDLEVNLIFSFHKFVK